MIHPEQWSPDASASTCTLCHRPFSLLRRRHHCRHCGLVFCGHCSDRWLWLRPLAAPTAPSSVPIAEGIGSDGDSASVARMAGQSTSQTEVLGCVSDAAVASPLGSTEADNKQGSRNGLSTSGPTDDYPVAVAALMDGAREDRGLDHRRNAAGSNGILVGHERTERTSYPRRVCAAASDERKWNDSPPAAATDTESASASLLGSRQGTLTTPPTPRTTEAAAVAAVTEGGGSPSASSLTPADGISARRHSANSSGNLPPLLHNTAALEAEAPGSPPVGARAVDGWAGASTQRQQQQQHRRCAAAPWRLCRVCIRCHTFLARNIDAALAAQPALPRSPTIAAAVERSGWSPTGGPPPMLDVTSVLSPRSAPDVHGDSLSPQESVENSILSVARRVLPEASASTPSLLDGGAYAAGPSPSSPWNPPSLSASLSSLRIEDHLSPTHAAAATAPTLALSRTGTAAQLQESLVLAGSRREDSVEHGAHRLSSSLSLSWSALRAQFGGRGGSGAQDATPSPRPQRSTRATDDDPPERAATADHRSSAQAPASVNPAHRFAAQFAAFFLSTPLPWLTVRTPPALQRLITLSQRPRRLSVILIDERSCIVPARAASGGASAASSTTAAPFATAGSAAIGAHTCTAAGPLEMAAGAGECAACDLCSPSEFFLAPFLPPIAVASPAWESGASRRSNLTLLALLDDLTQLAAPTDSAATATPDNNDAFAGSSHPFARASGRSGKTAAVVVPTARRAVGRLPSALHAAAHARIPLADGTGRVAVLPVPPLGTFRHHIGVQLPVVLTDPGTGADREPSSVSAPPLLSSPPPTPSCSSSPNRQPRRWAAAAGAGAVSPSRHAAAHGGSACATPVDSAMRPMSVTPLDRSFSSAAPGASAGPTSELATLRVSTQFVCLGMDTDASGPLSASSTAAASAASSSIESSLPGACSAALSGFSRGSTATSLAPGVLVPSAAPSLGGGGGAAYAFARTPVATSSTLHSPALSAPRSSPGVSAGFAAGQMIATAAVNAALASLGTQLTGLSVGVDGYIVVILRQAIQSSTSPVATVAPLCADVPFAAPQLRTLTGLITGCGGALPPVTVLDVCRPADVLQCDEPSSNAGDGREGAARSSASSGSAVLGTSASDGRAAGEMSSDRQQQQQLLHCTASTTTATTSATSAARRSQQRLRSAMESLSRESAALGLQYMRAAYRKSSPTDSRDSTAGPHADGHDSGGTDPGVSAGGGAGETPRVDGGGSAVAGATARQQPNVNVLQSALLQRAVEGVLSSVLKKDYASCFPRT